MTTGERLELHLPEGINYECTGCGKCCGGWSVPMTPADNERISEVDWGEYAPRYKGMDLFRDLRSYEAAGTPYTHAIKVGDDGHCPFLAENLCFIHSKFGSEFKPSICQLFPYCFNETPSGIYATISFVSMGAVHNSGKSLVEQRDYLQKKLGEFKRLYPDHHPNWARLELAGGKPISWEQYLEIEKQLIELLRQRQEPMELRLLKGSACLRAQAVGTAMPENVSLSGDGVPVKLKTLDKHLLVGLHRIYFPVRPLGKGQGDFSAGRFAYQVVFGGVVPGLHIAVPGHMYKIEELAKMAWPGDDRDIEDLLYRYFFSRIFGKLYFSAGFGQLSLIAGYHHLILVYALLKLQAKALARGRGVAQVSYIDVVAAVRQLEKRLGETSVGAYAAATYELLLFSHQRAKRLLVDT